MGSLTEERVALKMEEQLKEAYQQIGKIFYEDMEEVDVVGDSYKEFFDTVRRIRNLMDEENLTRQGKKRCPKCKNTVPLESKFCNMCGEKLQETTPVVEEESAPRIVKCVECGTILENDAVFCPNCGKKKM